MTEVLILGAVVTGLVLLLWPRLFGETQSPDVPETPKMHTLREIEAQRAVMKAKLEWAYEYAKAELGREPTNEEIFLTRDTLEDIRG